MFSSLLAIALAIYPDIGPELNETGPNAAIADCGSVGGQIAINRCYREKAEAAEVLMEAAWDAFVAYFNLPGSHMQDMPPVVEQQQAAQASFIAYRDAHCRTIADSQDGGSATEMVLYRCMAELTELRAGQLISATEVY